MTEEKHVESEKRYGIDALKKVVDFGTKVHEAIEKAEADGKVNWADAPLAMEPGIALFGLLGVIKDVPKEFGELDEEEKGALVAYARAEYDIADDKVEKIVERSFALALAVGDLIEDSISGDDA